MDPCYVSPIANSIGAAVKFPSIVQDLEKTSNAGAVALSSRYTPYEWTQMNLKHYNEADTHRNYAEKLRSDAVRVLR